MEIAVFLSWAVVLVLALGVARIPMGSMITQALLVVAAVGALVIHAIVGGSGWVWTAVGCAAVAACAAAIGAYILIQDEGLPARLDQHRKEVSASLVGLELPLIVAVGGLTVALAVR